MILKESLWLLEIEFKYFTEPSRTKQAFKQECDINHIMKKLKKLRVLSF